MTDGPNAESRALPPPGRWLSIIGIGEGGIDALPPRAQALIRAAELVFGGARHLALAARLISGEARPWPSPFDTSMVVAARGRRACVLASGDPFLHGVGATLSRYIAADEMEVFPAPSAFSLAAARMGWPLADVETVSVHGRSRDLLRPLLHPGARILALTSDAEDPARIAALLMATGFGASRLTALEALGGPRERIRTASAAAFDLYDIDPLNLLAIEVEGGADACIIPLAAARADDLFDHDGQITKREIRAVTLSCLSPRRGELLWDVGAGSGSIGIEWLLAHRSMRAIAIEPRAERVERIARNAATMGVPGLEIVQGRAPEALTGLATPDAIFIGGGATTPGLIDAVIAALRPGGRLVVNAVTLESEAILIARHAALGGELIRLAVSRAAPIAGMTGWRPALPVTIWTWAKP